MEHNFRVYKTAELAIICFIILITNYYERRLISYLQDIAKHDRIFYTHSNSSRDNQCTKSINHSVMAYSRMRANVLKERIEDPDIFTLIFIRKPLILLTVLFRHAPVPKQGTKHLVTDAPFLPCQLLVLPATI